MSWGVLKPEEITDEDRRIMAELIEEERREREEAFWRIGLDPGYNGEEANMDRHGDIFGCDECIKTVDAWDYMEE